MAVGSDESFSSLPLGTTEGLQREDLTGAYTTAYKAANSLGNHSLTPAVKPCTAELSDEDVK